MSRQTSQQPAANQFNYQPPRTMSGPPGIGSPAKQPTTPNRTATNGYARMQPSPRQMASTAFPGALPDAQQRPRVMSDSAYSNLDGSAFPTLSSPAKAASAGPSMSGPSFNSLLSQKQAGFSIQKDEFPSLGNTRPAGRSPDLVPGSPSLGPISRPAQPSPSQSLDPRTATNRPTESQRFGLLGLKQLLDPSTATNYPDLAMLARGVDLTKLGLDFHMRTPLSAIFTSPFSDHPTSGAVDLPSCYAVSQVPPLQKRISQLSELTLFYIFYSMPGDVMQLAASSILYTRDWRYHKELQLWITRDPDSQPVTATTHETGTYVVFDVKSWKKVRKPMRLQYDLLEERRPMPPAPL
eukprot:m.134763 g.134763  ORF g.134763 m.134763 type:complete len:352 (-) comp15979_c0_seq1:1453-2508(-)